VPRKKKSENSFSEELNEVLQAVADKKAEDLLVLDVSKIAGYTDHLVIATGKNAPQVQAMADAVAAILKRPNAKGVHMEGFSTANWVLIDGGDFVVHLFQPEARKFYALEDLWGDAPQIKIEGL